MSAWQWRNLTTSGQLVRLVRGVYAQAIPSEDRHAYLQRVAAGLIKRSDHYAVGASALAVHDLPNPSFRQWTEPARSPRRKEIAPCSRASAGQPSPRSIPHGVRSPI